MNKKKDNFKYEFKNYRMFRYWLKQHTGHFNLAEERQVVIGGIEFSSLLKAISSEND